MADNIIDIAVGVDLKLADASTNAMLKHAAAIDVNTAALLKNKTETVATNTALKQQVAELVAGTGSIQKVQETATKQVHDSANAFKELRKEILLYKSEAEKAGTATPLGQQFKQLAGDAVLKLKELQKGIQAVATETPKLDTLIASGRLMAASYAIATAAAATFSGGNKKVEETLVKLQQAMLLLNGIQEVHELIKEGSILRTRIQTAKNALLSTSIVAVSVAEAEAAGTTSLLAAAIDFMLGPIGLVILAATAVAAVWALWGDNAKELNEDLLRQAESSEKVNNAYRALNETIRKLNEDTLVTQGKLSERKAALADLDAKTDEKRIANAEKLGIAEKKFAVDALEDKHKAQEELTTAQELYEDQLFKGQEAFKAEQRNINAKFDKKDEEDAEKAAKKAEEERKKAKEKAYKDASDALKDKLALTEKGIKQEANLHEEEAGNEKAVIIQNEIAKNEALLIATEDYNKKQQALDRKYGKHTSQVDTSGIEAALTAARKAAIKLEQDNAIAAQKDIDEIKAAMELKTLQGEIARIEDNDKIKRDAIIASGRAITIEEDAALQKFKSFQIQNAINEDAKNQTIFQNQILQKRIELLKNEFGPESQTFKERMRLQHEMYLNERDLILNDTTKTEQQRAQLIALLDAKQIQDEDAARRKHRDEVLNTIQQYVTQSFQIQKDLMSAFAPDYDSDIKRQEAAVAKAQVLADKGNATLLEAEQKKLDELNKQKKKYVQQQQALALVEMSINAAIAVAKAAAAGASEGFGVGSVIAIALVLAAYAAGVAKAKAAASSQTFRKGRYTGDGDPDTIAGQVHYQEWVSTQKTTSKYMPVLEALEDDRPDDAMYALMENNAAMMQLPYLTAQLRGISTAKMEDRLEVLEDVLLGLPEQIGKYITTEQLNITERGLWRTVTKVEARQREISKRAR